MKAGSLSFGSCSLALTLLQNIRFNATDKPHYLPQVMYNILPSFPHIIIIDSTSNFEERFQSRFLNCYRLREGRVKANCS
jgi:hypothetical protein